MIWPAWLPPLDWLLKLASVKSCNLREFLSNCGILIKLSLFFKYFMILFTLSAFATVEFLKLVLTSHVWKGISGLVIPETQLSWTTALQKYFSSFSSNWFLDWRVCCLLKDISLILVIKFFWLMVIVKSAVPDLNVCFSLDIISLLNLLVPP